MNREKQNKRKNLLRWQENRLRRIDSKLDSLALYRSLSYGARMCDVSAESEERCRARGSQLANVIQVAWGKRYGKQFANCVINDAS